jgi:hypothetical protein
LLQFFARRGYGGEIAALDLFLQLFNEALRCLEVRLNRKRSRREPGAGTQNENDGNSESDPYPTLRR